MAFCHLLRAIRDSVLLSIRVHRCYFLPCESSVGPRWSCCTEKVGFRVCSTRFCDVLVCEGGEDDVVRRRGFFIVPFMYI